MRIQYDPDFVKTLKKVDVRIRKSFKHRLAIFAQNPDYPQLNNHPLKKEYRGYRSIDITGDWRAIYREIKVDGGLGAYFIAIGTHAQLYRQN